MTRLSLARLPKLRASLPSIEGFDVVRVILGLVLLAAAGLKGHQLATEPVMGHGLLNSRWFLIGQVEGEFLFGMLLLSGILPRLSRCLAIQCFSLFSLVALYKALSGEISCGCFGAFHINPWYTLAMDLSAIVFLLFFRPSIHLSKRQAFHKCRVWTIGSLAMAGCIAGGWTMADYRPSKLTNDGFVKGDGNSVILEPKDWIGRRFPLINFIGGGEKLSKGNWIVLLYNTACPNCARIIPKYRQLAKLAMQQPGCPAFAFVEVAPEQHFGREVGTIFEHYVLDLKYRWFLTLPVEIFLDDTRVISVKTFEKEVHFDTNL